MKLKITILLPFMFLLSNIFGQNIQLENKLKKHFSGLPILQSTDSIIKHIQSDTMPHNRISRYKIDSYSYYDSTSKARIQSFMLYSYYNNMNDSTHDFAERIFYGINYDTTNSNTSYFETWTVSTKLWEAKMHYRKLLREFSRYFQKTTSDKGETGFYGGTYKSTFFYLNKNDKSPFMEIYWRSAAHMSPNSCNIKIFKKD